MKKKNTIYTFNDEMGNIESSLNYFLKKNFRKNVKILDIGCNFGSLLYNIYNHDYKNLIGIDINKDSIKRGKMRYSKITTRLLYYNGESIPFEENFFDVILMFDVLEHIQNIKKFMSNEVYRVLKNSGILLFQTPNKLINVPWEIINHKSFNYYKKEHCSLQTFFSLYHLLKDTCFKEIIIEKNTIDTDFNRKYINNRLGSFGLLLLKILPLLPIFLFSNFWGECKK